METKTIQKLSNNEILRQQLELLAEVSKIASDENLPQLTNAMVEVYKSLTSNDASVI